MDIGLIILVAFGALSAWVGAMGIAAMWGYEIGRQAAFPQPLAFYEQLGSLFGDTNRRGQLYLLDLLAKEKKLPQLLYGHLVAQIPRLGEYYELHLLLSLLEKGDYASAQALTNAAPVLDHENFFMARRAFWFLEKQELPPALEKKVKAFKANTSEGK